MVGSVRYSSHYGRYEKNKEKEDAPKYSDSIGAFNFLGLLFHFLSVIKTSRVAMRAIVVFMMIIVPMLIALPVRNESVNIAEL